MKQFPGRQDVTDISGGGVDVVESVIHRRIAQVVDELHAVNPEH